MRNAILISILVGLTVLSACSGGSGNRQAKDKQKLKTLRLAYQLGHLPDIIAKDKHWFEDEFKNDSI